MTAKRSFDETCTGTYLGVLQKIASDPPSSSTLDPFIVSKIQAYLDAPEVKTSVSVWNEYKYLLDLVVRYAAGSSFILKLLDLESFFTAPFGAFSEEAKNMHEAPWRGF